MQFQRTINIIAMFIFCNIVASVHSKLNFILETKAISIATFHCNFTIHRYNLIDLFLNNNILYILLMYMNISY